MRAERAIRIGLRVVLALSLLGNAATAAVILRLLDLRDELDLQGTTLPAPAAADLRDALSAEREALQPTISALAEARRDLAALAMKRPADPDELDAVLARIAARSAELQLQGQVVMRDVLLTPLEEN